MEELSLLCFVLGFLSHFSWVTSQHVYYASTESIENLYRAEIQLLQDVELYAKRLEEEASSVRTIIESVAPDVNKRISPMNPLSAMMVFKRFNKQWTKLMEILNDTTLVSEREKLLEFQNSLPDNSDINGAFNGIFLLQETYNLDPFNFSNGLITNDFIEEPIQEAFKLSSLDLEFLGKISFNRGFYDRAIEWVMAGIERSRSDGDQTTARRLQKTLATLQRTHDEALEKKGSPRGHNWRTYLTPFNEKLAKKKKYRKVLKMNQGNRRYKAVYGKGYGDDWDIFNQLCRGENLRDPSVEKNLHSFYLHNNDPYLRLGPFKAELQNKEPSIMVIKDFIYDSETNSYIEFAKNNLEASYTINSKGENGINIARTSKQAWLYETYDKPMLVTKRIELASGLDAKELNGNEPYQVANYGLGGAYNVHTDSGGSLIVDFDKYGDRLATVMAYLSDVHAGGGTVFPRLGVKVTAEKGAAVFWYNVDQNGLQDSMMYHGGCPVLSGTKWITNKWIHEYPNWRTHPYSTSMKTTLQRFTFPNQYSSTHISQP